MSGIAILAWPEAAAAGASVCGGKGWNLGRLARAGFDVPPGGVLPSELYSRFMQSPALRRLRAGLAEVPAAKAADPDVSAKLAMVRAGIDAASLPEGAEQAVRAFLRESGLAKIPVAVRSSATAEDGPWSSFAGIHSSVLDAKGPDEVLRAIRACWGSLWTPQALAYRRRFLLSDDDVACAVVILAMVKPRAAGVAFSADPRTGRRDVVRAEAAAGVAEALVSGRVNPDEAEIERGTAGYAIARRTGALLSDDEWMRLARLTIRIEAALGGQQDAQDVEWALEGSRFWVIQARPATKVPRRTWPGGEALPVVWSNANLKDAVPGVVTEFTWGTIHVALQHMMFGFLDRLGIGMPRGMEVTRRIRGRAYFDLTTAQWLFWDLFGTTPEETNRGMGGHQPEIPVPPSRARLGRRTVRQNLNGMKLLKESWRYSRGYDAFIRRIHAYTRALLARDLAPLTNLQLVEAVREAGTLGLETAVTGMMANIAMAWQAMLEDFLKWRMPDRASAIGQALVAGTGNNPSADHGWRLAEMAEAVKADAEARAWLEREPLDASTWRTLPETSPFRRSMEAFLADFGHRAVYELEYANPRWSEDQAYLVEQVRQILASGAAPRPREAARAVAQAAEAEVRRRTLVWRPVVKFLARRARAAGGQREGTKSALVAPMWPVRRIVVEIGRRMTAAGVLARAEDAFQLAWIELECWLRGEWDGSGARALVADRDTRRAELLKSEPPDVVVLDSDGRPAELPATWKGPSKAKSAARGGMSGVGVSPGRATGPARLIRHPSEGARLRAGDVLVAPSTDPGWTPLFLRASAVVMEVGGALSHGAIVAREYGLPAVVNVPGVMTAVRDGDMLVVDGDAGVVTRDGGIH